jgi:hypothetical protein
MIFTANSHNLQEVLNALSTLRVSVVDDEYQLQNAIADTLTSKGISFAKEYKLGPRNRVDFMVDGGICLEVKKGKPYRAHVLKLLERYAASSKVTAIILAIERNMDLPKEVNGKPCISFGLNKLWGIAL